MTRGHAVINWIIAYLLFGVFFALMGWYGMATSYEQKSTRYKVKIILGLLFAWPAMIGYVLVLAAFFLLFGGLF